MLLILPAIALIACVVHAVLAQRRTVRLGCGLIVAAIIGSGVLIAFHVGMTVREVREQVHPADKATIYSATISEAINCSALVLLPLLVACAPLAVGEVRRRRATSRRA